MYPNPTRFSSLGDLGTWLPGTLLVGVGIGFTFPVLSAAAVSSLPQARFAVGSAVNQTARRIGGALGIAVLVALIGSQRHLANPIGGFHQLWAFAATTALVSGVIGSFIPRPVPCEATEVDELATELIVLQADDLPLPIDGAAPARQPAPPSQGVHLLDVASLGYFAGLAALVVVTRPTDLDHWAAYAQAGSHLVLMIVVLGSVLIGRPFTEAYARETTPAEYWHSATFHQTNMRISAAWGAAFVVGFVSLVLAATTDALPFLLRIAIPFGSLYLATSSPTSSAPRPAATRRRSKNPDLPIAPMAPKPPPDRRTSRRHLHQRADGWPGDAPTSFERAVTPLFEKLSAGRRAPHPVRRQ